MEFSYNGESNFIVWAEDEDGEQTDLLVNEIGNYKGTVTNAGEYRDSTQISIDCDGSWTVTFRPMSAMPTAKSGDSFTGDTVVAIDESSEVKKITFTCDDDGYFGVFGYPTTGSVSDRKLLANESIMDGDGFEGTESWGEDQGFLAVQAPGKWTVSW
ncbi:MAG: hypothetical protein ACOYCA_02495 [Eggerthellaceae bacterium]|jgi:hypothetical protein